MGGRSDRPLKIQDPATRPNIRSSASQRERTKRQRGARSLKAGTNSFPIRNLSNPNFIEPLPISLASISKISQRQRQIESEYAKKLQELSAELASRDESQRNLEAKVKYLEHENALLESRERELEETVKGLLQSRDSFISVYEDSTYTLRCAIETRDKRLAVLSEKIQAHLLLFDSIEKETAAVQQVLDRVQELVNEKEYVVIGLKAKTDKISSFEKDFGEKICVLERKLCDYQHEIRRRNAIIVDLKEHLEVQKANCHFQPQIEELQKALSAKEEAIQTLTSEKEALHLELQNLEISLQKIQDVVTNTNMEDKDELSPGEEDQEACRMVNREENGNLENIFQERGEDIAKQSPVGCATENAVVISKEQHTIEDESSCKRTRVSPCLFKPPDNHSPRREC
ncbi:keratin, type II cytoskeletal 8 isoform X2 [Asparagus officinalis]|uniref:keratin, type II cytoskeletal 8 isoform X2 n=1 Tax=Asparagus officinalis TaxID=4686 RepID=UPI00098DE89B|nr:keratin, type II cytoskeletal 8 isoform X2 [Asparagus officinalis]